MKYEILKKHSVEVTTKELIAALKAAGVLPKEMKADRDIHAGTDILLRAERRGGACRLVISWQETEVHESEKVHDAREKRGKKRVASK